MLKVCNNFSLSWNVRASVIEASHILSGYWALSLSSPFFRSPVIKKYNRGNKQTSVHVTIICIPHMCPNPNPNADLHVHSLNISSLSTICIIPTCTLIVFEQILWVLHIFSYNLLYIFAKMLIIRFVFQLHFSKIWILNSWKLNIYIIRRTTVHRKRYLTSKSWNPEHRTVCFVLASELWRIPHSSMT